MPNRGLNIQKKRPYLHGISILFLIILITISLMVFLIKNNFINLSNMNCETSKISNQFNKPIYIFEWRNILKLSTEEIDKSLKLANRIGINNVFLNVENYVEISEINDQAKQNESLMIFNNSLMNYIKIAKANNIKVSALAGGPKWSDPGYWYISDIIIDQISNYNQSNTEKITSVNIDVEPYSSEEFKNNYKETMINYIKYVEYVQNKISSISNIYTIRPSFSVPFWLDTKNDNVDKIEFNNSIKFPFEHLIDIVQKNEGKFIVMSYRNYLDGENGVYDIIDNEINIAKSKNYDNIIIIGQEISDVTPDKITYFNQGYDKFVINMNNILNKYKDDKSIHGISINDMASLDSLYENRMCKS